MPPDNPLDGLPNREISLNDIDRAHELLSNHVAMTALCDLYRSGGPAWVAQTANRQAAIDAITLLEQAGLITTMTPGVPDPSAPVAITGKGTEFIEILDLNE